MLFNKIDIVIKQLYANKRKVKFKQKDRKEKNIDRTFAEQKSKQLE